MSVQLISVVILLFSIVLAMGDKPENTSARPAAGGATKDPLTRLTSCQNLTKFSETVKISAKDLKNSLETCWAAKEHMNGTGEGAVLLELYDNLKKNTHMEKLKTLFESEEIIVKIEECVSRRGKNFSSNDARKHLGFKDTLSLKFEIRNCLDTIELQQCVEDVYIGKVKSADMKNHKDAFMSSFEMLSEYCEDVLMRDDRSRSEQFPPSLSLIAATALMLFKLTICNAY